MKFAGEARRSGIGLTSADTDCIVSLRDDRVAILSYHAQVTWRQIEVHLLCGSGFEVNALKSAESDARRALFRRKLEIELHDLVSRYVPGIGHRGIRAEGLSGGDRGSGNAQIAVAKFCVAKTVPEGIKRLASKYRYVLLAIP
jgi:hypothetical protein